MQGNDFAFECTHQSKFSTQHWERRKQVCNVKIRFAENQFMKLQWSNLLRILEILGDNGMSSDESATEEVTYRPCYQVTILLWRHDFDAMMDIIDDACMDVTSGYSNRGSKPTPRHHHERHIAWSQGDTMVIKLTRREPVCNLPIKFYDEKWLNERTDEYVEHILHISREGYQWVHDLAQSYSGL